MASDASGGVDALRLYLDDIGRVDLLASDAEVDLAKRVRAGVEAAVLLESGHVGQGERERLERLVELGELARSALAESNLRLVVAIAKRFQRAGFPLADLIQEGNLGLLRAVEGFDHTRGYRFSTYATWWIRQSIGRGLSDQGRTIRIPAHLLETMRRVTATRQRLLQELGREPTSTELAEATDLPRARIEEFRTLALDLVSLDAPVGEDGSAVVADLVVDAGADLPSEVVGRALLHDDLVAELAVLSERERRVVELRFGLTDDLPRTLEQVGETLGLTRERVRQIEGRALLRLRRASRSGPLGAHRDEA